MNAADQPAENLSDNGVSPDSRTDVGRRAMWVIQGVLASLKADPARFTSREDMAREARMSASYFTRMFKAVTRRGPMEYLVAVRKEQAQQLLADPLLSIKEVAGQCGFQNPNYFSTWFKKHVSSSPSAFRAQIERE